jgi:hypothetical protein
MKRKEEYRNRYIRVRVDRLHTFNLHMYVGGLVDGANTKVSFHWASTQKENFVHFDPKFTNTTYVVTVVTVLQDTSYHLFWSKNTCMY